MCTSHFILLGCPIVALNTRDLSYCQILKETLVQGCQLKQEKSFTVDEMNQSNNCSANATFLHSLFQIRNLNRPQIGLSSHNNFRKTGKHTNKQNMDWCAMMS